MIETLDSADRAEIVETIAQAFSEHPMLPADRTGRKGRLMARSFLDAFAAAPDARLFGVRRQGRLDCVGFVFDAAYEPRGLTLLVFLFRMIRMIGWRKSRLFGKLLSEKSDDGEQRLELMLLGTRTDSQGQGLGHTMMQHILDFARRQGYRSVELEVAKETPAFAFYLREGFLVQKEIALPTMPICLLRHPLDAPVGGVSRRGQSLISD